jgi:hypothetical protein
MINKDMLSELKPIISDPAWAIIVKRLEYLKDKADTDLHNANGFQAFCEAKGAYNFSKRIYELFKTPDKLADDGIYKIPGVTET